MKLSTASQFLFASFIISVSQGGYQQPHPIPYALSPVYLQYLENVETEVYNLLKHVDGEDLKDVKDLVSRYLTEFEGTVLPARKNASDSGTNEKGEVTEESVPPIVSSNPILALQMINRFVKYFKYEEFSSIANDVIVEDALPTATEVTDAMEALLRLQYMYDLDAHDIAEGYFGGHKTSASLSTRECYELGKFAQESAYFTLALQWFDVTLKRLRGDKESSKFGLKENMVLKAINETIEEHNEDYEENIVEGDMYSFSQRIVTTNYSKFAHLSLRKTLAEELTGVFLEDDKDPRFYQALEANTMALCSGRDLRSEKVKSTLGCYLDTKRHPYWAINPLKIEQLSNEPPVIQIYEVFSDKWIRYLKDLSYGDLERAPMPPDATPRTAAYAWFDDTQIPEAPVSKVVEFITHLNVQGPKAAESLQVAAYAFGGHVEPHFDSRGPNDPEFGGKGDRVTTFLVYLNEVEQGGLTAFPLLGIHIKPVKRSAVLWYTNLRNGEIDERMLHAACPVISGHKWIATKWTHINENFFKHPCGLRPDE